MIVGTRRPASTRRDERTSVAIFRAPLFNPSETFVRAHVAGLDRYRPLLVGLEDKGNIPPDLASRTILAKSRGEALRLKLFGEARSLATRLKPFAPALVHAHFGPDGVMALPLAEALGLPLVTTLHGYDVGRKRSALLLSGRLTWMSYALRRRTLQRRGHLFLTVSEALRRDAVALGYPPERTITHYLGVRLDRFAQGPGADDLILFVGRLVEKKGADILLRAFAGLRKERPRARLVVIGDGPRRSQLARLAGELELGASVEFLGSQPPEVVGDWMRRASVLAVPSVTARDGDREGLPTVLVEAAACALPAVGSDHGGIPEAIVDRETGFLFPEGDVESLRIRLATLLASRALRDRMGGAARALAERKFDFHRQIGVLERHYDALLDPEAAGSREAGGV